MHNKGGSNYIFSTHLASLDVLASTQEHAVEQIGGLERAPSLASLNLVHFRNMDKHQ